MSATILQEEVDLFHLSESIEHIARVMDYTATARDTLFDTESTHQADHNMQMVNTQLQHMYDLIGETTPIDLSAWDKELGLEGLKGKITAGWRKLTELFRAFIDWVKSLFTRNAETTEKIKAEQNKREKAQDQAFTEIDQAMRALSLRPGHKPTESELATFKERGFSVFFDEAGYMMSADDIKEDLSAIVPPQRRTHPDFMRILSCRGKSDNFIAHLRETVQWGSSLANVSLEPQQKYVRQLVNISERMQLEDFLDNRPTDMRAIIDEALKHAGITQRSRGNTLIHRPLSGNAVPTAFVEVVGGFPAAKVSMNFDTSLKVAKRLPRISIRDRNELVKIANQIDTVVNKLMIKYDQHNQLCEDINANNSELLSKGEKSLETLITPRNRADVKKLQSEIRRAHVILKHMGSIIIEPLKYFQNASKTLHVLIAELSRPPK